MKLLREAVPAEEVIEKVMSGDPLKQHRQMVVVDVTGRTAVFTGSEMSPYCGSEQGENFAVAGCGLPSEDIVKLCASAFQNAQGELAQRLVDALATGAAKCDDHAACESAVVRISRDELYPYLDLRVDRHENPVAELARLLDIFHRRAAQKNKDPQG